MTGTADKIMTGDQEKEKQPVPRGWRLMKLRFRRCCAWIVGLVYFISGLLKLIDPTGAGLVMEEYFHFLHLNFLQPAALAAGTAFAFLEVLLGIALLTGIWRKIAAISIMTVHSFFTLITVLLLIFNPVMDCGCFGEAVHMTHFQTFIKNIILLFLLLAAYVPFKRFGTTKKRKYVSAGILTAIMSLFMIWSLTHLPAVDFTDFKASATILAGSKEINADDIYESVFIYSKEGKTREFDLEHLPDSTWSFENTVTRIREHEGTPVLSFHDASGFYQDSLAADGKVAVISVYDPQLKPERWEKIEKMVGESAEAGFKPLLLVSNDRRESTMPEEMGKRLENSLYQSDYKTLVTLNRSNGGLTYLNDGYIVCKTTWHAYPETEELKQAWNNNPQAQMMVESNKGLILLQSVLIVCLVLIMFI